MGLTAIFAASAFTFVVGAALGFTAGYMLTRRMGGSSMKAFYNGCIGALLIGISAPSGTAFLMS